MSKGEVIQIENGVEWKINDFFSKPQSYYDPYSSPSFVYEGTSWKFSIYPNGHGSSNNGYVSFCVVRNSHYPPIYIDISLSVKTVNGLNNLIYHCATIFDFYKYEHEFSRLLSRFDLIRRKTELVPSDVLTIVCTFKIPKFTERATTECSYCKAVFDAESISSHEKKCMHKPIKCPYCSDIVVLENWFDHDCQKEKKEGGANASGLSLVHHHHKILQDFKQLFLEQKHCDAILRVKEQEFSAHKAILIARSPVFASTFGNDMKEKESGIVNIEDCDPSVFPDFLCFLYSDNVDSLSQENVFGLFTVADKYDVPDLRTRCLDFMKENLSVDTFCQTITLALKHSQTEMVNFATDFFVKNAPKIIMTAQWQSFLGENPTQSNELFIKFVTFDKSHTE